MLPKINHVSLKIEDLFKKFPLTLEKDLQENERICTTCNGLGMIAIHNIYGIKGDESEKGKSQHFPYDKQAFSFCPNCFNGVQQLCEYCRNVLPKGRLKCTCETQKDIDEKIEQENYQLLIDKATEVKLEDCKDIVYFYCEEYNEYYGDIYSFVDEIINKELDSLDEFPTVLWLTYTVEISIDAESVIESACDELHEDASDNCDYKELQELLDNWCKKQTGTTSYFPDYEKYVRVKKEWFE